MYKLFYTPGSSAMAPGAVLEEIGAAYEPVLLDVAAGEHQQAAYRRLNPSGRIPTLIDGDFVLFETAAICQYLCDQHPDAGLAPPLRTPERGRFYQWLAYMSNTVQVALISWWHPDWTFPDDERQAALKQRLEQDLTRTFEVMNDGISGDGFVIGATLTVCDIYLAMLTRWSRYLARPAWTWPRIRRAVAATYSRPSFQRMMEVQGTSWAENWPED